MGIESYSHSQVVHAHGLPSLPFELQICILSQVSIHQIFALRRVSRAWHSMLSNPNLESVLMDLYPFLTSAPTLAALAKRRLRILRNEPVAIIQRLHRGDSHFAVTLLQGGYDVQIWCTVFIGNNTFRRQLIIKDWNRGGKLIAQLDLLKVLEAEFPEIYTKYVGDPLRPKRGAQVLVRHPQIHGGILMVVLQFAYVSERIGMVHILFVSLETGSLVNSLAAPAPCGYLNTGLAAFNGVLVTIGWIPSRYDDDGSPPLALDTYRIQTKAHLSTIIVLNYHRDFPFHLDELGNAYFPSEASISKDGWYKAPIEIKCISTETGISSLGGKNIVLPVPSTVYPGSQWRLVLGAVPLKKHHVFAIQLPDIGAIEYQNVDSIPVESRPVPVFTRTTFCSKTPLVTRHMTTCIPLPTKVSSDAMRGIRRRPLSGANPEKQNPLLWGRIWDSRGDTAWWGMISNDTGCWEGKYLFDGNDPKVGNIPLQKLGCWDEGDDGIEAFHMNMYINHEEDRRESGERQERQLNEWGVRDVRVEERKPLHIIVLWDENYTF